MKKLAYISGAIGISILLIGIILRILQWTYADWLLMVGLGILAIVFIPAIRFFLYHTGGHHYDKNSK